MAPTGIKAHVLVGALPFISHFIPMQAISKNLLAQGYQVTFITGEVFRKEVQQTGATCVVPAGWADFNDESASRFASRPSTLSYMEKENLNTVELFFKHIQTQFDTIQTLLASRTGDELTRPVVLVLESNFLAGLPFRLGAPGLQPNGIVTIGILPILTLSIDTAPPGQRLLPDNSSEGRRRNESLNKTFTDSFAPSQTALNKILHQLGARTTELYRHNAAIELSDKFLQLCSPSLEYPRSDLPPNLFFTGGLPRSKNTSRRLPTWWNEVSLEKGKKHIVAVSQGTVIRNYNSLIIPTLEALADRDDVLIVVALGKNDVQLPSTVVIPKNSRVADWIPFDDLLQLSDVFVTNGGYGSFQNAVARGVPLVIAAPEFADKMDIADRVEWSGSGINLKTGNPSQEDLRKAIMEVLTVEKYKRRVAEIQAEIESYDPMAVITNAIDEVAAC